MILNGLQFDPYDGACVCLHQAIAHVVDKRYDACSDENCPCTGYRPRDVVIDVVRTPPTKIWRDDFYNGIPLQFCDAWIDCPNSPDGHMFCSRPFGHSGTTHWKRQLAASDWYNSPARLIWTDDQVREGFRCFRSAEFPYWYVAKEQR